MRAFLAWPKRSRRPWPCCASAGWWTTRRRPPKIAGCCRASSCHAQDDLAARVALLDAAVRLRSLLERELAVDRDLELAGVDERRNAREPFAIRRHGHGRRADIALPCLLPIRRWQRDRDQPAAGAQHWPGARARGAA